ncbi:putative tyrosine-protein kinase, partial [Apostichopus japonicus]
MTMLLKGHFNSEERNKEYQCYVSDGHEGATVESFRAVNTRNTRRPNLNPDPPDPIKTLGTYPHWKVTLDNYSNNDFGVFGCRARQHGRRNTEVTGVFMRSNAHFTPHDGLFSKTVALGDRDVQIRMTKIGRNDESHPPRWLKDNVVDPSRHSLIYRIAHGIQSDDDAVYGCFRGGLRDQAMHGIQILIVR